MSHRTITALEDFLRPHVALGKSRLETLCLLIVGIVSARTVNLGHVACERGGSVRTASTYRRLQRFFQYVRLGEDWALPLVAGLVGPARRWTLVLDRTNWSIGSREVNYLVLAVVTRRFRVPLALDGAAREGEQLDGGAHRPRSGATSRTSRPRPSASCLPTASSSGPTGSNSSTITISPSSSACGRTSAWSPRTAASSPSSPACTGRGGPAPSAAASWTRARRSGTTFAFAAKRLPDGWLTVVSNLPPRRALAAYRRRWAIESMFGDAKTRGLNIEDTRLTCPAQARPPDGHRRHRPRLGRTRRRRPSRHPRARAEIPRPPRPLPLQDRPRPHPKPAQVRSRQRNRPMAET